MYAQKKWEKREIFLEFLISIYLKNCYVKQIFVAIIHEELNYLIYIDI